MKFSESLYKLDDNDVHIDCHYHLLVNGNVVIETEAIKIQFISKNSLYVTIGDFQYYMDSSTGKNIFVKQNIL
jgi:hypothetical protein